jgi:two-component system LytT family response regulator
VVTLEIPYRVGNLPTPAPIPRTSIRTLIDDEPLPARGCASRSAGSRRRGDGRMRQWREAIAAIRSRHPDLIFLDAGMPEVGGFGVLEAVTQSPTVVRHRVRRACSPRWRSTPDHRPSRSTAPILRRRSPEAVRRREGRLDNAHSAPPTSTSPPLPPGLRRPAADSPVADQRDRLIEWRGTTSGRTGRERHLLRDDTRWRRSSIRLRPIHRSTMVNLERVRELVHFHGDHVLRLADGTKLTLSRTYRERLQERLGRTL